MSEFTAGPWFAIHNGTYWEVRTVDAKHSGHQIGDACASKYMLNYGCEPEQNRSEENARLMAAAPELLEALEQAVTSMQDSGYPNSHAAVRAARAAIAKARSQS